MTRRQVLATVAAAAASVLTATAAEAAPPDETADGDVAVLVGSASVGDLQFIEGSGNFTFASTACAVASLSGTDGEAGEPGPDLEASRLCSAQATGVYNNIVCGTGFVNGTGSLDEGATSDSYSASFHIDVLAGVGVLTGTASETENGSSTTPPSQPNLAGLVALAPQLPGPANACTIQFTAAVALVTTA
jgi:hypothetical protein